MKFPATKHLSFLAVYLLLMISEGYALESVSVAYQNQAYKKLTLEEAKEIVDIFFNNPTAENYKIIQETIYPILNRRDEENLKFIEKLLFYCVMDDGGSILEYEMFTGNVYMAMFARRLLDSSDGAFAEDLANRFGNLIRLNPKLFLTVFKTGRNFPRFETIVAGSVILWGSDTYRRYERYNLTKRIEALRTVTDPDLIGIRDYCISILEDELNNIKD